MICRAGIKKEELEGLLGCSITEGQFAEALACAVRKQAYIYEYDKRPVVLQKWYLMKLTEEYVRNLAFSEHTMDLCRKIRNMEKEHPAKSNCQSALTDVHIVTRKFQ